MKHYTTYILILPLWLLLTASYAQDTSTQGTEFWVSFMSNGHKYHPEGPNNGNWILTQVLVSGKRDCDVTLINPQTGWTETHQVLANNITTIDIDENIAYIDGISEHVTNKGLQIISTDTVSLFCTNIAHLSFDASYVLPTQSLADDYIIQTYDQSNLSGTSYVTQNQTSAFLIVATEDNTIIDITPSVATLNGHPAGHEFTITMNKGQAFQVRSNKNGSHRDLSGSRVTAHDCKRIAVFNGNTLTAIPNRGGSYDHVFEQAMPVQSWGKRFVITKSLEREYDIVKIISATDNNEIYKNGVPIDIINAGESYSFELRNNETSCFVETSGRVAVYLYNKSRDGNSIGDPSMVWIAPVEQRIDRITFSTFNNENFNINNHYINIIVNTEDVGNVFLDNQRIPSSEFSSVTGNNDFSFTRKNILHGVHHLRCGKGFNAHVYGFGTAKGYAYLIGSKTEDLTIKVELNETLVQPNDTISHCVFDPILFDATVNLSSYDLFWDFGDGTTSSQNPITHDYSQKGFYEVSLIISSDEVGGCVFSTSDTLKFYVDNRQKYTIEEDEICKGDSYSNYGFNVVVTNDTILRKTIDNPEHPHCPDSLLVYITTLPGYYAAYNEMLCWTDEPFTYTEHGFNLHIDHPDTYTDQISVPIPGGCDSIIDLKLTVTDRIVNPHPIEYSGCAESFTWNEITYNESGDYEQVFTLPSGCDSIIQLHIFLDEVLEGGTDTVSGICTAYEWHGHLYEHSGSYTDTIQSALGCDSIVHLDLYITPAANPSEIHPMDTLNQTPHWVITSTEFEIRYYDFSLWDTNPDLKWDSVVWNIENQNSLWKLMPFGENNSCCRVVVLNRVEDTIWLCAKVYDPCFGESIERRYWLLCSFYGLEENDASIDQGIINIVPNPNNGQMSLLFDKVTAMTDTKVYDMKGVLIDHFTIPVPNGSSIFDYTMKTKKTGLYLFVFSYKENFVIRKAIITE